MRLLATTTLLLLACTLQAGPPGEGRSDLESRKGALVVRHLLSGELAAERAVDLVVPEVGVGSLAIRWLVENGTEVAVGDVVAELDSSSLVSNLEQLDANYAQALMGLESAISRVGSEIAEAEFEVRQRQAGLEKARIAAEIPQELRAARDYEKLQLDLRKAELELTAAKRQVAAKRRTGEASVEIERIAVAKAEQKLLHAREGTEKLVLRAPRAGIALIQEDPRAGRLWQVADDAAPGWTIARLPDVESFLIVARLFDVDDRAITPGMAAKITLDTFPDVELSARVRSIQRIARLAHRRSLARVFEVLVDFEGADTGGIDAERMLPGMSARVVVEQRVSGTDGVKPVLAPREALEVRRDGSARVRLHGGALRPVLLGPCSPRWCIVEDGLDAGVRLAVAGSVS